MTMVSPDPAASVPSVLGGWRVQDLAVNNDVTTLWNGAGVDPDD